MFDGDETGQNGADKAARALLDHDLWVKVIRLPEGKDPDDFTEPELEHLLGI